MRSGGGGRSRIVAFYGKCAASRRRNKMRHCAQYLCAMFVTDTGTLLAVTWLKNAKKYTFFLLDV